MRTLPAVLLVASACSSTPAANDGGMGTDASMSTPGAALNYTVNGTAVVSDKYIMATPGNGMDHITLRGTHYDSSTAKTYTLTINLYNTTGTGTYKCSDNLANPTTNQWTNLTYDTTQINTPDLKNPAGPRTIMGDCTANVTAWATKTGDHYQGSFSTSGVTGVDIQMGVFDLARQ